MFAGMLLTYLVLGAPALIVFLIVWRLRWSAQQRRKRRLQRQWANGALAPPRQQELRLVDQQDPDAVLENF